MQDSWTTILVHGNYVIGSVRRHRGTGKRNRESNGWHYSLRWREQSQCHRLNEYDLSGDGVVNAGGVFMAKGTDSRGIFRLGDTGQVNSFNNPIPGTSFTASGNIEVGIGSGSDGQVYQSGGAVNTNTIFWTGKINGYYNGASDDMADTDRDLKETEQHILQQLLLCKDHVGSVEEFRIRKEQALSEGWNGSRPMRESEVLSAMVRDLEEKLVQRLLAEKMGHW
jgi:hypothetical protein